MTTKRSGVETRTPAEHAYKFRVRFLAAVTQEDLTEIARALLTRAKTGDPAAAKLVLDRLCGPLAVEKWPTAEEAEEEEDRRKMFFD